MKNKARIKANLAMVAVLGALGFAGAANAAITTKSVVLGWAGTILSAPSTSGEWKFVDILSGADYVPTTGKLDISNGIAAGTKSLDMAPFRFGIKATGTTLKASSTVKAYLAYPVTFAGLNATDVKAQAPTATISANGLTIPIGTASAVTVANVGANPTVDPVAVSVTGKGTLPADSFSDGDNVSVSATVMFTAEV